MHLLPSVAKQPNLELKTQSKQLLGSLPLVIALPGWGSILLPGSESVTYLAKALIIREKSFLKSDSNFLKIVFQKM